MKHLRPVVYGLDVAPILEELAAHPRLWNQYTLRTTFEYSPHGVDDIWVRYRPWMEWESLVAGKTVGDVTELRTHLIGRFVGEPHESVWYPAIDALPSVRALVFELMRHVEAERLGGVLITRIPAHGEVSPHIDRGWHAEYYEKIAVQLKSAPGQAFCFADGRFECEPGTVYAFDNSFSHWVENPTEEERMTLIICVRRDQRKPPLHSGPGV
jgi:hypothetical protein